MIAGRKFLLRQFQGRRMIFACGVRFIRLRSVAVSGWASRSARAARSMASAVIGRGGLGVLPEVVVLLILLPAYPPLLGKSTTPRVPSASSAASLGPLGPPSRILAVSSSICTSMTAVVARCAAGAAV